MSKIPKSHSTNEALSSRVKVPSKLRQERGDVSFFGVRHHSPGCAQSLSHGLRELKPDIVLIEGPPEANIHLNDVLTSGFQPPVALLLSMRSEPSAQVTYPFAEYSPEWVALRYAARAQVDVEMIDAPYAMTALRGQESQAGEERAEYEEATNNGGGEPLSSQLEEELREVAAILRDPLAYLASLEGTEDHEGWWAERFEKPITQPELCLELDRSLSPLRARVELLYEALSDRPEHLERITPSSERETELKREAYMRLRIHEARRRYQRVAVICGAWHVQALRTHHTVRSDRDLLRGARRAQCEVSWVPWSDRLLTLSSGYGAGIPSPSWFHLLWRYRDDPELIERALCEGAEALRIEGHHASSASVIDAARLTRSLGEIRGRSWVELDDLIDAARATLCHGDKRLIHTFKRRVSVGERYGEVPSQLINIALTRSFHHRRRQLRIRLSPDKSYDLSLRLSRPRDLEKSIFLHRAQLLGLFYQTPPQVVAPHKSSEHWQLLWSPKDEVHLNQHGHRGVTLLEAAKHLLSERVESAQSPDELIHLACIGIRAALPEVIYRALFKLDDFPRDRFEAGVLLEVITQLTQASGQRVSLRSFEDDASRPNRTASPPKTNLTLTQVIDRTTCGLIEYLPAALSSLSSSLRRRELGIMASLLYETHDTILQWGSDHLSRIWCRSLRSALNETLPPVIAGRLLRCLARTRAASESEVFTIFRDQTREDLHGDLEQWLIGLVASDPRTLESDSGLMSCLDDWFAELSEEGFLKVLPALRRAFASCERRANESLAHSLLNRWDQDSGVLTRGDETISQRLWSAQGLGQGAKGELFALTRRLFEIHTLEREETLCL